MGVEGVMRRESLRWEERVSDDEGVPPMGGESDGDELWGEAIDL